MRYALYCGTLAGLTSTMALMLLARLEGHSPWQPANATSHWIWGDDAGSRERADMRHTLLGLLTNQLAAMFWGMPFGAWLASRPSRDASAMLRDATLMASVAAAVDYLLMPKRLTPGWELALPKRSVAAAFGAMALGLALGGLAAQSRR
ncbi:hypothetical protein ATN84_07325 [Paramesorhizobium deserti]|uniref:Uncharacterized protein n=1 Tax=Paramesorhizobium deserti TaxID=1494590 RepID=A0A135HVI5_9HYPH|nr:hypothetical protein [Paramesorhizobium deserti]KXF77217.1 hypothetical protein ATN84_07325 [Paramesorhizobium deserti]